MLCPHDPEPRATRTKDVKHNMDTLIFFVDSMATRREERNDVARTRLSAGETFVRQARDVCAKSRTGFHRNWRSKNKNRTPRQRPPPYDPNDSVQVTKTKRILSRCCHAENGGACFQRALCPLQLLN